MTILLLLVDRNECSTDSPVTALLQLLGQMDIANAAQSLYQCYTLCSAGLTEQELELQF